MSSTHYFSAGSCRTTFYRNQKDPTSLHYQLQQLGLLDNKQIPEFMFTAGTQQRLEVLAGIIDTDGTTDKHGRINSLHEFGAAAR
jgi:hypothetical protein